MKDPSPREIIVIVSATLSLVLLLFLILFDRLYVHAEFPWYAVLGISALAFVTSYLLLSFFIEKFIYRRIKLIYKTIHNLKAPLSSPVKVDMSTDLITEVEDEVLDWAKRKSREIEELKNTNNYRREFIGNVSHELKTPLFNVQGYIHTLIDGGLEDVKVNKSYLYKASQNIDRLEAIINDLDTISQLESSTMTIHMTRFDITRLIKEVLENMELPADLKDISLEIKAGQDKPTYVMADRERIHQVITNLISNSIKYGKHGGTTQVGIYDMHDNILVEITDDGIGIAKEHLARLFERFYRVDTSRSREQGGTGLGLAIVKHIIEAHNQTVNVRSTVDVGSTFGFTLKRA